MTWYACVKRCATHHMGAVTLRSDDGAGPESNSTGSIAVPLAVLPQRQWASPVSQISGCCGMQLVQGCARTLALVARVTSPAWESATCGPLCNQSLIAVANVLVVESVAVVVLGAAQPVHHEQQNRRCGQRSQGVCAVAPVQQSHALYDSLMLAAERGHHGNQRHPEHPEQLHASCAWRSGYHGGGAAQRHAQVVPVLWYAFCTEAGTSSSLFSAINHICCLQYASGSTPPCASGTRMCGSL